MRTTRRQRRNRVAFTLIELLVAVTILGILASVIVPRFFSKIGGARQAVAQQKIAVLETKVLEFQADCGRLPTSQEGLRALLRPPGDAQEKWKGPYVKDKDIVDPWGEEFIYRCPGRQNVDFDIMTLGADKAEGGESENADVVNN